MTVTVPESFTAHMKVLQHHIDQGKCGHPVDCAVALALIEMFSQAMPGNVTVGSDFAVVMLDGQRYETSAFPSGMADLIRRFDAGQPVQPAEFDLTFKLRQPW